MHAAWGDWAPRRLFEATTLRCALLFFICSLLAVLPGPLALLPPNAFSIVSCFLRYNDADGHKVCLYERAARTGSHRYGASGARRLLFGCKECAPLTLSRCFCRVLILVRYRCCVSWRSISSRFVPSSRHVSFVFQCDIVLAFHLSFSRLCLAPTNRAAAAPSQQPLFPLKPLCSHVFFSHFRFAHRSSVRVSPIFGILGPVELGNALGILCCTNIWAHCHITHTSVTHTNTRARCIS